MKALRERFALVGRIGPASVSPGYAYSGSVDMSRWGHVLAVLAVGSIPSGGSVQFKIQESADGSNWTDLAGKAIATLADTQSNKQALIEVRADELSGGARYLRAAARTLAEAVVLTALVFAGDPRFVPVTDDDLASVVEIVE